MRRILPPVYFLLALVAMVVLHLLWPIVQYWSFPINLFGLLPLGFGVWLNVKADGEFNRHGTTVKPFERSSALVTAFPFSMSRNPMYLGVTAMLLGVALLFGTVTPLVPAGLFPVLMDALFIRTEETMLAETFGDEWKRYAASVRRWV